LHPGWPFPSRPRIARLSRFGNSAEYFDTAYFGWQGDSAERSAGVVVPLVVERFHPRSVIDLGCGAGGWLKVFREHGVEDVLGVDGAYVRPEALRIRPEEFVGHDLAQPLSLDRRYDVAISLEAAHYLPEGSAAVLVESLTATAPVVLFGAAVPHQPGGPAQNLQWPSWWAELFAAQGFGAEDWLRPLVWEEPGVDWWYAQNTILYVQAEDGGMRPPPLVHPGLLAELARRPENKSAIARLLSRLNTD
jgi:SAM-dependent methyltransferase